MAVKTYQLAFENDPAAPTVVRGTTTHDGVDYDVVITPRTKRLLREGIEKQSVSQHGRGNVCGECGRPF
jgi:hypothetical protein